MINTFHLRCYPSLEDAALLAYFELMTNPTITTYVVNGDGSITRQVANPWVRTRAAFRRLGDAAALVGQRMQDMAARLVKMPDGTVVLIGSGGAGRSGMSGQGGSGGNYGHV